MLSNESLTSSMSGSFNLKEKRRSNSKERSRRGSRESLDSLSNERSGDTEDVSKKNHHSLMLYVCMLFVKEAVHSLDIFVTVVGI